MDGAWRWVVREDEEEVGEGGSCERWGEEEGVVRELEVGCKG
ncbi:hypothetical protein Pcinc_038586, partial [Petrolisthes cinctipes]